jgi:hypothetical protein
MVEQLTGVTLDNFGDTLAREMAKVAADPAGYVEANHPPVVGNPITLGDPVLNAEDWAKRMIDRATNAATDWLNASLKPKAVPSKAALAANTKRVNNLQKSITDKTWEGAMAKVDEDQRLKTITKRGAGAFSSGVSDRSEKIGAVVGKLQPLVLALKKTLDGMPQDTDAQREAKMIAAKRGMQAIGLKMKGL